MSDFYFTNLEPGEEIVFGVVTASSSHSSTDHVVVNGQTVRSERSGETVERKAGVTNRRVIAEESGKPDATKIAPNDSVTSVAVKRDTFMGKERLSIESVTTASGDVIPLGMNLFPGEDEALIGTTFPQARISYVSGESGAASVTTTTTTTTKEEDDNGGFLGGILKRFGIGD